MILSSIQIITLVIFIGSLSIIFINDIWKNRKLKLGIIEGVIIPILILLIILCFKFEFIFTKNIFVSLIGLLLLIGGLIFSFISVRFLGSNIDDFWIAKRKAKKRTLVTKGPYSKIRHPIYTGMLIYYFGLILVFFHLITISLYVLLLIGIIHTAISEEKFLKKKLPKYKDYMKRTGRFFPKI